MQCKPDRGCNRSKLPYVPHPKWQEAMHDWHYFFNHVPHNVDEGTYRIFEPQWKAEIRHWFGREDVAVSQKEEFLAALISFDDGSSDFYRYRAYFLAGEALAYFPESNQADEIVEQLLKWSYIYFQEEQNWQTFPMPLGETARVILQATDRKRVIAAFVQLLHTTESPHVLRHAAERLGRFDPGNKTAIAALVLLMQVHQDMLIAVIRSLQEIGSGNETALSEAKPKVIATLVHLVETTQDKSICYTAIRALGKIADGNPIAIAALVQLLQTDRDSQTCREAADALGQIARGNEAALSEAKPKAIATLAHLVETTQDKSICSTAIRALGKIAHSNQIAIAALIECLTINQSDDFLCDEAAIALWKIARDDRLALSEAQLKAIAAVSQILETAQSLPVYKGAERYEYWHLPAISCLDRVDPNHQLALNALVDLVQTTVDSTTLRLVARQLAQLDPGNKLAKGKLDIVVATLVQFIQTFEAVACDAGDWFCDESSLLDIADSLRGILQSDHLPQVVTALKDYLGEKFYKNFSYRYEACYRLIWYCAQTMTYLEFYKAWHN